MIRRLRRWWGCRHGHDMCMVFPTPESLFCVFECSRCRRSTPNTGEAYRLLTHYI